MNTPIFVLCVPEDYEWTSELVARLRTEGYTLYLESQDVPADDLATRNQTAQALYAASLMLVIISRESVLGDSAEVFEAWWRPYIQRQRPVLTCLAPEAPPGAENWMPYDLTSFPRVDFSEEDDFIHLCNLINQTLPQAQPQRPRPVLPAIFSTPSVPTATGASPLPTPPPHAIAPSLPRTPSPLPQRPPLPSASATHAIERAQQTRQTRRFFWTMIQLPLVIIGLAVLWIFGIQIAEQQGAEQALFRIFIATGIGLLVGFIYMLIRTRGKPSTHAYEEYTAPRRPDIYLEVLSSMNEDTIGKVWTINQFTMTLGRKKNADIYIKDNQISPEHCVIFYSRQDGRYYLENLIPHETVLYDYPMGAGEVRQIANGDLIVLGRSVVMQFRTTY